MEVVLGAISFPTVEMEVDSYIYKVLKADNMDFIREYELEPFTMTLQSIERSDVRQEKSCLIFMCKISADSDHMCPICILNGWK